MCFKLNIFEVQDHGAVENCCKYMDEACCHSFPLMVKTANISKLSHQNIMSSFKTGNTDFSKIVGKISVAEICSVFIFWLQKRRFLEQVDWEGYFSYAACSECSALHILTYHGILICNAVSTKILHFRLSQWLQD